MYARLFLLLIFAIGQAPDLSLAMVDNVAGSAEPAQTHCAEHTDESGGHHCDHVTQCQCAQACGSGMVMAPPLATPPLPGLAPRVAGAYQTRPANRRLPLRPPSL